jgi:hypothetical protein
LAAAWLGQEAGHSPPKANSARQHAVRLRPNRGSRWHLRRPSATGTAGFRLLAPDCAGGRSEPQDSGLLHLCTGARLARASLRGRPWGPSKPPAPTSARARRGLGKPPRMRLHQPPHVRRREGRGCRAAPSPPPPRPAAVAAAEPSGAARGRVQPSSRRAASPV